MWNNIKKYLTTESHTVLGWYLRLWVVCFIFYSPVLLVFVLLSFLLKKLGV